jgi:hypothetical protein
LAYARIDAIRQHEIDNAELSAEGRRRFAPVFGQILESFAASPRHDDRERSARQATDVSTGVISGGVTPL